MSQVTEDAIPESVANVIYLFCGVFIWGFLVGVLLVTSALGE